MPVLHLGVDDIPYSEPPPPVKRGRKPKAGPANETTGDVAELLEDKYHIMQIFYEQHQKDIALALEESLAGTLENLLLGAPTNLSPLGEAADKIQTTFKRFLSEKEMDRLGYPGIPTKASLMGISHRFKGKRGSPRPSFIDTGLYENSFRAWVD
jgi:hypothetical protein